LSDFGEILYAEAELHADKGSMIKTASFLNPRWRTAAILIIVKLPYTVKMFDFDKIWCTTARIEPDEVFKSAIAES